MKKNLSINLVSLFDTLMYNNGMRNFTIVQFIDYLTGEIILEKELTKKLEKKIIREPKKTYSFTKKIEINKPFIKMMDFGMELLKNLIVCNSTDAQVLTFLSSTLEMGTNYCKVEGKRIKYEYIASQLKKSLSTIKRSIKRLVDMNALGIFETPDGTQLVMNPHLFLSGQVVPVAVNEYFKERKYGN